MRTRTLAAWISTAMLVGLIVVSYGLDWRAALWGDFNAPPAPPAHTQLHWQVVETYPIAAFREASSMRWHGLRTGRGDLRWH